MIKVDVRNETASNHSKQTQMGGLGDESASGKTREINNVYFHMHKQGRFKSGSESSNWWLPWEELCSCK